MQRILIAGIDEPEIETVVVMSLIAEQHARVTLDVELAVGVVLEEIPVGGLGGKAEA